jgi:pimeloyl-ACP methyl ester carboxylesterase
MISIQEINGLKIAYWVNQTDFDATKKTLVFVHGSGGDHTLWIHQYTRLKNDFNIVSLNLPGHGLSEGRGEQDVAIYVEWVEKILEKLAIRKPVLIGHSLGAAICLVFALQYGDRLSGIVPVGGGATMPVNQAILDGVKVDPAPVIAMVAKFSFAKVNRERLTGLLTDSMTKVNPEILYGDFLSCNKLNVTERVSQIQVPTLIICGDDDKMTPPSMSQFLKDHIPGARLSLISNAGHFVMIENVEEFNRVLKSFVESLP